MKHHFTKFYALLAATAALSSSSSADADQAIELGLGYRQDTITWNVDRDDLATPFMSEDNLRFHDLDIIFIAGRAKGSLGCAYYRADAEYGWIFNGRSKEKGQWTIAQTQTEIESGRGNTESTIFETTLHNRCKKRYTFDFNLGVGIPFNVWCSEFQFTPMIGYSYNTQRLRAKNNDQFSDNFTDVQQATIGLGASEGGHSNYRTTWWGPWIGFDMAYATCDCGIYYSELEFHFARTRRQRDTDQGTAFDHYQRTKTGYIFAWKVGAAYALCDCWLVDASLKYTDGFSTNNCSDKVSWRSGQVRVDAGYRF